MPNIDTSWQSAPDIAPQNLPSTASFGGGGGGGSSFLSSANFGQVGGAVSSIFGAIGDFQEASAYNTAAKYSMINAGIAKESERIQTTQANRQINKVLGTQQAQYGGAGLAASGSALDVMRASASQGALQKAIIQEQGQINVTGYEQAASQYKSMASAATTAGIGGILGSVASVASMFSDSRLKHNINFSYVRPDGINIYTFSYNGSTDVWSGVLAQDVQRLRPDAVGMEDGFLTVDYNKLGLLPLKVA